MSLHKRISLVKSALRIGGLTVLPVSLILGALVLIVAEFLGVLEEVWEQ